MFGKPVSPSVATLPLQRLTDERLVAMPLDNDPIYCAEQIVIPPDLGDILKAYAKEVIRNEPEDIFEFSAKYFAQFVTSGESVRTLAPRPRRH